MTFCLGMNANESHSPDAPRKGLPKLKNAKIITLNFELWWNINLLETCVFPWGHFNDFLQNFIHIARQADSWRIPAAKINIKRSLWDAKFSWSILSASFVLTKTNTNTCSELQIWQHFFCSSSKSIKPSDREYKALFWWGPRGEKPSNDREKLCYVKKRMNLNWSSSSQDRARRCCSFLAIFSPNFCDANLDLPNFFPALPQTWAKFWLRFSFIGNSIPYEKVWEPCFWRCSFLCSLRSRIISAWAEGDNQRFH